MIDRRISAVMRKELRDVSRHSIVLASMAIMPLFVVGMIIGLDLWIEGHVFGEEELEQLGAMLPGVAPELAIKVVLNDAMVLMLVLMVPTMLPLTVATYSIVGEKEDRSLEPLLATPMTTMELIVGKTIAYALPVVLLTWASFGLMALASYFILSPVAWAFLLRPAWTLGLMLLTPPLSVASALIGLMASARAKDPKSAQAWGMVLMPPIVLAMLITPQVLISTTMVGYAAGGALLLDVLLLRLAVPVFAREHILTRWK